MTVTVSPAAVVGSPLPPSAEEREDASHGLIVGRAAVRPLGAVEEWPDRTFGVSFGYVGEVPPDEELFGYARHGGFVGLAAYPWTTQLGASPWFSRVGVVAMPELLVLERGTEVGGGMTFTADAELFSFASGGVGFVDSDGAFVGGALGEGGIGVSLSTSVRGIGRMRYWTFGAGVLIRLPATGGLALIPAHELLE
jgi:hypothetical protein